MKKTIYKGICVGAIALSLILIAGCIAPLSMFSAGAAAAAEQDTVHFINPTAISVVDNNLYVTDIVEDNKTAILCFDISSSTPILKYTYDKIDGVVSGLSHNKQDTLYLNMGSKVVELKISGDGLPTTGKTYQMPIASSSIIDVAYGKIINSAEKTVYALTKTALYQYNESSQLFDIELVRSLDGAKSTLSIDEAPNYQLYYISGTNATTCNRMNLSNGGQDGGFADKLTLTSGFAPTGMLRINSNVALYNNDSIYIIEETTSFANTTPLLTLSSLYASDCRICDVESYGDRLFILNSKNKIDVFDKTEDIYNNLPTTTIGSDMVDKAVPTAYTSFTLVRPKGYPTNIVYKTNAATSVADIITDASEYVILGYEGDAASHYYYVMVGDKFGWVKKSDGAESPDKDSKLNVVNNRLGDGQLDYTAKFVTLKAVYVYELPLSNSNSHAVEQAASKMKSVNVLQQFAEGEQVWYLVEYDEGKTGFVKKEDVGQFHITTTSDELPVEGPRKINSSLFSAVNMYLSEELKEDEKVADSAGNEIKLYSGDLVTLVRVEGASALISVRTTSDGERSYGWIEANRLIGKNAITTNAIVGLSLLAFALALAGILIFVYFHRKKRIKANKD